MAEILTSDLIHDGELVARRGDKAPKGLKDKHLDELRETGVLLDENKFDFEPEGGRPLPENLGRSFGASAMDALEARMLAVEGDKNQKDLLEKSKAGEPLDLAPGDKASAKEKEEIKKTQRHEVRTNTPDDSPEEDTIHQSA